MIFEYFSFFDESINKDRNFRNIEYLKKELEKYLIAKPIIIDMYQGTSIEKEFQAKNIVTRVIGFNMTVSFEIHATIRMSHKSIYEGFLFVKRKEYGLLEYGLTPLDDSWTIARLSHRASFKKNFLHFEDGIIY